MRKAACASAVALLLGFSATAGGKVADTYTVAPNTTDAAATPCTSTGAATFSCANIRSAVAAAKGDNGSTVKLSAGVYALSTGQLTVTTDSDFTIAGAGSGQTTIQQTTAGQRVLKLNADLLTISGVTITGGNQTAVDGQCTDTSGDVDGGGIFNAGTLSLSDVTVSGNKATGAAGANASSGSAGFGVGSEGGGICSSGALTVIDSTITNNRATGGDGGKGSGSATAGEGGDASGGGIESSGDLTLSGSSFEDDQAIGGAAGPATGTGTADNGGLADGGAIALDESPSLDDPTASIDGSRIEGSAEVGGAGPHVASSTPLTNVGGFAGGAIEGQSFGATTISGSTIAGNTATGGPAGTRAGGAGGGDGGNAAGAGLDMTGPLTMTATTVSGNTATGGRASTAPGGAGGMSSGGGVDLGNATTIVNATIVGNASAAGLGASAQGGGIYDQQIGGSTTTLASVTLAHNSVTSATAAMAHGGDLYRGTDSPISLHDTIIGDGSSSGDGSNCAGKISLDGGHNLESTTPTQCGLDPAAGDLIGIDPLLGPLSSNGGATQTMSLRAGSHAIGAGGQCTDPTQAGQPLKSDQRGEPRADPCDVGAFEGQPPRPTALPSISGSAAVGRTLMCRPATFAGDAPLTSAVQWQRDRKPVAKATRSTYKVTLSDATHRLTCQITETNAYGQATATSTGRAIPYPRPTLGPLHESHKRWRPGSKLARLSSKGVPIGTTFTVKLNAPARLTLKFKPRHGRAAGTLSLTAKRGGTIRIRFAGRLSKHKRLAAGSYKLSLVARDRSGAAKPRTATFTIV
jgi:hypothetical protein